MSQASDHDEKATVNAVENQTEQPQTNVPAGADESAGSPTSERKKQANRENAKHSTGPKTEDGKSWSRYNAIKHGFSARDVVIRHGDGKENPEEFELLLKGLRRAWKPQDIMQECLVRTIAEADWRLRRAARAEVGEIRRQTDSYYARQNVDLLEDVEDMTRPFWTRAESKSGARDGWLRIQRKVTLLEQVRIDVEKNGYVGEELQHALDSVFGENHRFADNCHRLSQLVVCRLVDQKKSSSPDLQDKEGHKAGTGEDLGQEKDLMLRLIKRQADGLKQLLADLDQAEDRELQATLLACNLPSREFVDKLIRYEAAQENRKNKAIALLMKLQSRKR